MLQPSSTSSSRDVEAFITPHADEAHSDNATDFTTLRADCCGARAAYRALLAGGHGELLFCGHHFRGARTGLDRDGARAYDGANRLVLA